MPIAEIATPSAETESTAADVARTGARRRSIAVTGLIGVVVAYLAIGALFAMEQPPFVGADEKAHLGYAYVVADGALPTIDQRLPVPTWADQWLSETIYTRDDRNRSIWVANHPPLFYMSVAPVIWWSELTERADGGLLLLRFANIAYGAVGIVFTYAIGLELTRSSRIALLSAATAATMTQLYASLSLAMSDGLTYAAGAAVTWAGIRCLRRGPTTQNLVLLAATTAVASGARAVTMLLAFGVVGTVAVFEYLEPRPVARDRWLGAARVAAIGAIPALAAWGWFYIRNIVLYGDIGASAYLLDRFDRVPSGGIVETVLYDGVWRSLYFRSMSPVTYGGPYPPLMLVIAVLAMAGLAVVVATRRTGDRDRHDRPYTVSRRSIVLLAVGVGVIVAYIAQHLSGGGYLHPRYAFPIVGSVAVAFVLGLDRIVPRVLPTMLVVGMATWTLAHLPIGVDPSYHARPRDQGRVAPAALRVLPADAFWRAFAGLFIVVGCVIAATALFTLLFARERFESSDLPEQ